MANCKDEPLKSYFEQLNPNERRVQAEIINQIEITIPNPKIQTIEKWFEMNRQEAAKKKKEIYD